MVVVMMMMVFINDDDLALFGVKKEQRERFPVSFTKSSFRLGAAFARARGRKE